MNKVKMKNTKRIWIMYIIEFSLNFFDCEWDITERHFIVWAAKISQHIYFKGILTSKFETMLLWKKGTAFVSTDENLWIPYRLMWFDGIRPPKFSVNRYFAQQKSGNSLEKLCPNSQNDCL